MGHITIESGDKIKTDGTSLEFPCHCTLTVEALYVTAQ